MLEIRRYSTDKKGKKIDNFFRSWVMANIQANNDSAIILKKRAAKEYTKYAQGFYLPDYQTASEEEKQMLENEWQKFAEEFIHVYKTDRNYSSSVFGFGSLSDEDINAKIKLEIENVTLRYARYIGLEELYQPLYLIMKDTAERLLSSDTPL
jgi:hypothetical protein